jgi:hypothetical protein
MLHASKYQAVNIEAEGNERCKHPRSQPTSSKARQKQALQNQNSSSKASQIDDQWRKPKALHAGKWCHKEWPQNAARWGRVLGRVNPVMETIYAFGKS